MAATFIRDAYSEIPLTVEQASEMAKILQRPMGLFHFIKYVKISTNAGDLPLKDVIKDFQFDMLENMQDSQRSIILASRQMSKCVVGSTKMKVRNDDTGEEFEVTLEEFYKMHGGE